MEIFVLKYEISKTNRELCLKMTFRKDLTTDLMINLRTINKLRNLSLVLYLV